MKFVEAINEFQKTQKAATQRLNSASPECRRMLMAQLTSNVQWLTREIESLDREIRRTITIDDATFLFTRRRRKHCLELLEFLCKTPSPGVRKFPKFDKAKLQEFLDFCEEMSIQTGIPQHAGSYYMFNSSPLGMIHSIHLGASTDWKTHPKRKASLAHLFTVRKAIKDSLIVVPIDTLMVLATPSTLHMTRCFNSKLKMLSLDLIKEVKKMLI